MKEWINKMEAFHKTVYPDCFQDDGSLLSEGNLKVDFSPMSIFIELRGSFTIEQLEAVVNHMKKYNDKVDSDQKRDFL